MIEQMLFFIDFKNVFILIFLNVLDIELKEDSDTDELKEFNINVQTYLVFKGEHEEFTVIKINFNIAKNNREEYPYDEDDLYLESNNVGYHSII